MSYATVLLAVMWLAVTAYALLAGADFGAGTWDLLAGSSQRGASQRSLIEHSIGPVWEANHVWLIFVLVIMWTAFPPLFAALSSTLYIPLTLIALGVIARGSAFAFRKVETELWQRRLFGAVFAFSSVVTPFFLGATAGAVASGRVPPGVGRGNSVTSWTGPVSILAGCFAVTVCGYLAAVYLTADARRAGDTTLTRLFRRRALGSGVVVGAVAAAGLVVVHADAPRLYDGLSGKALPLVVASVVAGLTFDGTAGPAPVQRGTGLGRARGHRRPVGLGVAQYPHLLLPGLTVSAAAAPHATLTVTTGCVAIGMAVVLPSLGWLLVLFQRSPRRAADVVGSGE